MKYIISEKSKSCIFCLDPKLHDDAEHYVVYRSTSCFVILNLFPYNNGHIMVVPNRHVSQLADLSTEEVHDLFSTVQLSEKILRELYTPDGLNIGMNIGKAAGAGIDEHIHVHLVPRWNGDTNFMTTVGGTRVIPDDFAKTFKNLKELFDKETR
jgi:ATP adenylyltransferase